MRFLLDEHLSPKLVATVRALAPDFDIESIHFWKGGRFVNRPDERILRAAAEDRRVLVTFDVRTIPGVLVELALASESHAGVIFVSARSFPQNDFKGLAHAIAALAEKGGKDDWTNRVVFLTNG